MILKAAELAAGKASPLPYITSVLSSWKTQGVFSTEQLSAQKQPAKENYYQKTAREEREAEFKKKIQSYYFNLREKAQDRADYFLKRARANAEFRKNEEAIKAEEIQLAKAEALGGDTANHTAALAQLRRERADLLSSMHLTEAMLSPQYRCKKCGDTGFDKDGNVCECYKKFVENASEQERLSDILDAYSNIDL